MFGVPFGETLAPPELGGLNVAHKPIVWGEDLHWWHTLEGRRHYQCEDFEPSAVAIFDVTVGDSVVPTSLESFTNGRTKATGSNGHETTLSSSPNIYESGSAVQHNLGHWVTTAPNVLRDR